MIESKRLFMKPGRDNKEERDNFVRFWANYINSVNDDIWSKQQNVIINSQMHNSRDFYKNLNKTEKGREVLRRLKERMLSVGKIS